MIVRCQGLCRTFQRGIAEVPALCGVTLDVAEGELVALSGPSGCGKTTLLHLMGLLDPGFEGELSVLGSAVRGLSDRAMARMRLASIGFVFQSFHLLDDFDVRGNVALPHWQLHGSHAKANARAEALLEGFGLGHRSRHDPRLLSGGEMQRVAVARALVNEPALVLADEPTGNLDSQSAAAVLSALGAIGGSTLVVASHDPTVVAMARRVVKMRDGRIVE